MNSLKNLLIIAVLAAVGYGVYVSLARNNAEPDQPPGVAEGWPSVPQVELPGASGTPSAGGPLALGGSPARPTEVPGFGMGGPAPPLTPPTTASPANNLLSGVPPTTPATPYPSSAPLPVPPAGSMTPPSGSTATLGPPVSADFTSALASVDPTSQPQGQLPPAELVRNLAPPPETSAAGNTASATPTADDSLLLSKFTAFMAAVQQKLDEGKFAEAHLALSTLYDNADMPADQAKQITNLLDQLAGTVIYSRQHSLEPGYVVRPGDTVETIARQYSVPWQLLARINGLMPPDAPNADNAVMNQPLPAGTVLKVVRGPFDAVVRLDRREMTLLLQNRYAGRFPIGVGCDHPKLDGNYTVCNKTLNPTYYGPDGANVGPNDPRNPLGGAWIGLTDRIGIHGTSDPQAVGRDDNRGAICLGQRDLQDLYGILSVGSRVTILR